MLGRITERYLKDESKQFDLLTIFNLNVGGKGVHDVGCVADCTNLIHLDLSSNKISSVMALRSLTSLVTLDVSCNRLTALSGIEQLKSLRSLDATGNFLNSIDCLLPLTKLEELRWLKLVDSERNLSNPMYCSNLKIDHGVMDMLPNLQVLNGLPQTNEGKEFTKLCDEVDNIQSKYGDSVECDLNWKPSSVEDNPFLKIGLEKNGTYEKTLELASECEEKSRQIHDLLATSKEEILPDWT